MSVDRVYESRPALPLLQLAVYFVRAAVEAAGLPLSLPCDGYPFCTPALPMLPTPGLPLMSTLVAPLLLPHALSPCPPLLYPCCTPAFYPLSTFALHPICTPAPHPSCVPALDESATVLIGSCAHTAHQAVLTGLSAVYFASTLY